MVDGLLSIVSVIFFCMCCYFFLKTVTKPIPLLAIERKHARAALQVEKVYKSIAWGIMTVVFLTGLIISFYQVFTRL